MFKSIFSLSPLLHFLPPSFFVANPALWFPGSARLSISSSLHLSAAAEPGPHHPACQSPLYTFNPSYPSLCKADSHTVPRPPHHHHPRTTTISPSSFQNNCHHRRIEIPLTLKPAHSRTNIYRRLNGENTQKDTWGEIQAWTHAQTEEKANTGQRNDLCYIIKHKGHSEHQWHYSFLQAEYKFGILEDKIESGFWTGGPDALMQTHVTL